MSVILKKELKVYITSMSAYFYYALFFLLTGLFFVSNCLKLHNTLFGYYVLSKSYIAVVLMLPLCTMRLFSQERKDRTDQLLFTAPVYSGSIVLGKYLAAAIYLLTPILLSIVYPLVIAQCGPMSVRFLSGSYIALFMVTLVLLSVGMFISALCSNPVLAAVITYAVYALILLGRVFESIVSSEKLYKFLHDTSIYNKYNDMISGIVRSGDLLYFLLLAVGFFLLTWFLLQGRLQNIRITRLKIGITVFLMLVLGGCSLYATKVYDFTVEQLLTLSDQTKEIVGGISRPTTIYYIGEQGRANATYQELLNEYARLNDNIEIVYKRIGNDSDFREKYLKNLTSVKESSILVVSGERYVYLDSDEYVSSVQTSKYSYKSSLDIENQLTSAIYYTNSETTNNIYMLSGHNEKSFGNNFSRQLMLNNYNMVEWNLSEKIASADVVFPDDCKAVIINAPESDYSEAEIAALEEYIGYGGKLFVSLDALNEDTENIFAFLKKYGLEVLQGVVVEQDIDCYAYDTVYYLIPKIRDTEFTQSLLNDNMRVLTMTSKGIAKSSAEEGYTFTDVLTTSSRAFSKVDDFDNVTVKGENDISGPFSVAAYSANPDEGSLFLITSDMFFHVDVDTDSNGANRRLFLEIMNQMTGNDTGVLVMGKEVGNQTALYPATTQAAMKVLTVVVVPVVILLIGIVIIILRNKHIKINVSKRRKYNVQE